MTAYLTLTPFRLRWYLFPAYLTAPLLRRGRGSRGKQGRNCPGEMEPTRKECALYLLYLPYNQLSPIHPVTPPFQQLPAAPMASAAPVISAGPKVSRGRTVPEKKRAAGGEGGEGGKYFFLSSRLMRARDNVMVSKTIPLITDSNHNKY